MIKPSDIKEKDCLQCIVNTPRIISWIVYVKITEPTKAQKERMNKGITFPRVIHKKRLKTTSETIKAAINQEALPVKIGNNKLSQSKL